MASAKRPGLVAAIAIIEILLGIFALVGGILHLALGIGGLTDFSGKDLTLTSQTATILQDVFTVEGIVLLAAGYAVWSRKKWGWNLTLGISIIGLITSIAALAIQSALSIIGLIGNIVIIALIMTRPAKAYFGRESSAARHA